MLVGVFLEISELANSESRSQAIVVIRWFMAISPPRALSHPHQCWRKMMNSHWTSHFVNVKINNVSFISFDFSHLFSRQLEVWYVSPFESGRRLHMDARAYTSVHLDSYVSVLVLGLSQYSLPFANKQSVIFSTQTHSHYPPMAKQPYAEWESDRDGRNEIASFLLTFSCNFILVFKHE